METPTPKYLTYYELTDLIPSNWVEWFYAAISENAPFSWGDNNRTLVTVERFVDHMNNRVDGAISDGTITQGEYDEVKEAIESLGSLTYIDLEN